MATNIKWQDQPYRKLYFGDVPLNAGFRIVSPQARGAVYQKVKLSRDIPDGWDAGYDEEVDLYFAKEVATGMIFKPTLSQVELVDLEISVAAPKPSIYE